MAFLQCAEALKTSFVRFFLVSHPPLSIRNSLPFTSLRSVTIGLGRGFLEGDTCRGQAHGLLEPADPEPVVAGVGVVHADVTTVEAQAVRVATIPRVSTRRPIEAAVANVEQPTRDVETQGGQVEVIACVSGGWEAGVINTTIAIVVVLVRCTHVG